MHYKVIIGSTRMMGYQPALRALDDVDVQWLLGNFVFLFFYIKIFVL